MPVEASRSRRRVTHPTRSIAAPIVPTRSSSILTSLGTLALGGPAGTIIASESPVSGLAIRLLPGEGSVNHIQSVNLLLGRGRLVAGRGDTDYLELPLSEVYDEVIDVLNEFLAGYK